MQSSPGPPCVGGAALKAPAPPTGAAPFTGNDPWGAAPTEALGAEPFTGGNAELVGAWPGSGAGKPCAWAPAAPKVTMAAVIGTIK